MTTDLDPRFRRADGLSAPDLWPDIARRAEEPARGLGFDRRRWLTIAVAAAIAAGAFGGLWRAFNGNGREAASGENGPIVFAKAAGTNVEPGLTDVDIWARDPLTGATSGVITKDSASNPVWSPDGSHVAYQGAATQVGRHEVVLSRWLAVASIDQGTTLEFPCGSGPACIQSHLAWSPDGTRLAFVVRVGQEAGSLLVLDVTTGAATRLCSHGRCGRRLADLAWSPDGTRIAFANSDFPPGEGEPNVVPSAIWVARADGSEVRRLTRGAACQGGVGCTTDTRPVWSPDGRSLVFLRTDKGSMTQNVALMRMDASGAHERALRTCRVGSCFEWPAWSPDRRMIAGIARYSRWDPKTGTIELLDPATGAVLHRLEPAANPGCAAPLSLSWSPDSTQLLVGAEPWQVFNLCTVPINGGLAALIAHDVERSAVGGAAWLPAGSVDPAAGPNPVPAQPAGPLVATLPLPPGTVVFEVQRMPGGHPRGGIYQVASDGSGFGRYFSPCVPAFSPDATGSACEGSSTGIEIVLPHERVFHVNPGRGYYFESPAWSSVGDRIAFTARAFSGGASIWVTNGALGDPVRAGQLAQDEAGPVWSPDGTRIAAVPPTKGFNDATSEIDLIDSNSGAKSTLMRLPGQVYSLAWSPDGQWIAFRWDTLWGTGIWLVHPDGTGLRQVPSATDALLGGLAWSPDSQYLVFGAGDSHLRRGLYATRIADGATTLLVRAQAGVDGVTWVPGSS